MVAPCAGSSYDGAVCCRQVSRHKITSHLTAPPPGHPAPALRPLLPPGAAPRPARGLSPGQAAPSAAAEVADPGRGGQLRLRQLLGLDCGGRGEERVRCCVTGGHWAAPPEPEPS